MTRSTSTTKPVSVMYSFARPDERSNPYVKLLIAAVDDGVDVRYFSWTQLIRRPPDVLHVHWPETMVRGSSRWKTHLKSLFGIGYLLVHRLLGTKLVWTAHNTSPHETEGAASALFCRLVAQRCDHRIVIQATDDLADPGRASIVLHGTFLDWYGPIPNRHHNSTSPVHLLFAGLIRPYKGVPELIRAFRDAHDTNAMQLTVRGAADDPDLRRELQDLSQDVAGIDLTFGHLDDQTLADTVAAADLVVLPYRRLHNSGAALLALSLGRAVLLPSVDVARDLQREFGPEWVYLYEGELEATTLCRAVHSFAADSRHGVPDMSDRQWEDAGQAHVEIYRALR